MMITNKVIKITMNGRIEENKENLDSSEPKKMGSVS